MLKKIFILSLIVSGILVFFWGVYNLAFKKNTINDSASEKSTQKESASTSQINTVEKIEKITEEGALAAMSLRNGNAIRYYAKDGKVWEVDLDSLKQKAISEKELPGITNALWSPDGAQVITSFSKEGSNYFYTYNYQTSKGTKLKSNLDSATWDSMGAKIIYKYFDPKKEERTLNVANPDGSEWKKIADLSFKRVEISAVPQSSNISFWNTPKAEEETQLFVVGAGGTDLKKIFSGKFGADYLWSPNGQKAIVGSLEEKNSKKFVLGMINKDGEYTNLGIPTLASKCVWSADNKTIYYALPGDVSEDAVMPDEYLAGKLNTVDTFWKMNLETGKKERIIELKELDGKYDASEMFLSGNEDALFFINRTDSKIYRIKL